MTVLLCVSFHHKSRRAQQKMCCVYGHEYVFPGIVPSSFPVLDDGFPASSTWNLCVSCLRLTMPLTLGSDSIPVYLLFEKRFSLEKLFLFQQRNAKACAAVISVLLFFCIS